MSFIRKIKTVLETFFVNIPKRYTRLLPRFWNNIIINATIETIKYTLAGKHKSFSLLGNADIIMNYI